MQFLKKHYEKIILSVVLLGLAAAAFWLSISVKEAQGGMAWEPETPRKTSWVPLDLTKERAALSALQAKPSLELSGAHNLFNPVTWKRLPNGTVIKVLVEGAGALAVADIRPLFYKILFDSKVGDGYYMIVEPAPPGRKDRSYYKLNVKDKTKPFVIVGTNDAPDGTPLQLLINDTGEKVSVSANNPYKRVDSYEADLKYTVDSAAMNKKRVGDTIMLSETEYKIILISSNSVTVQDSKNQKRTSIPWLGAGANAPAGSANAQH